MYYYSSDQNTLYIAEASGGEISQIDLNESDPKKTIIATNYHTPQAVFVDEKNDDLYFTDMSGSVF